MKTYKFQNKSYIMAFKIKPIPIYCSGLRSKVNTKMAAAQWKKIIYIFLPLQDLHNYLYENKNFIWAGSNTVHMKL